MEAQRLIILDTETTGTNPAEGHRIVEIGCVELVNMRVGAERQWYINPEREIPQEAINIHGITNEMVAASPPFRDIAGEFVAFVGNAPLVAHNAGFDMGFINAELKLAELPQIPLDRAIDTLPLARRKFPGASASLDALCKRFDIDLSQRTFHGALLDAHLLAAVYVELMGGNQFRLELASEEGNAAAVALGEERQQPGERIAPRSWPLPAAEAAAHGDYLALLAKESGREGLNW